MRKVIFALIILGFIACHKEPQYPCENNIYMEIYKYNTLTGKYDLHSKDLTPECACVALEDKNAYFMSKPPENRIYYKCNN